MLLFWDSQIPSDPRRRSHTYTQTIIVWRGELRETRGQSEASLEPGDQSEARAGVSAYKYQRLDDHLQPTLANSYMPG